MIRQIIIVKHKKDFNNRKQYIDSTIKVSSQVLTNLVSNQKPQNYDKYLEDIQTWIKNGSPKRYVYVETEQELLNLYTLAKFKNLIVHICKDKPDEKTKSNQDPVFFCLAIGPHNINESEPLISNLKEIV